MVRRIDWDGVGLNASLDGSAERRAKKFEHLLKVATNTNQDAGKAWAALWAEFKPLVGNNGMVMPEAQEGFVPACGWPEFLEKLWLLKHYLDSTHRICTERQ